jgi:hypothetical protein
MGGCSDTNVPSSANFTNIGPERILPVNGISLVGVRFETAENMNGVDPFFPAAYGSVTDPVAETAPLVMTYDACLGHTDDKGKMHFHFMPPCIAAPNTINSTTTIK